MAAAAGDHVEDEDDEFDAYNPHPYGGGYDISATYGAPLPPSPTTCYPVSSPASPVAVLPAPAAPPVPAPGPTTPPPSSSPAQPRPVSPQPTKPPQPPHPPVPVAEPYYWPKPHDYGDAPRGQPMYATPEVFRGWPYLPGPQCHSRCGPRDYWRQCMRGLDYLFGHSDGYGERRIGVDCHGVPVYANKKGGVGDAVVVEVAPPAIGNVEWHDAGEVPDQSNRLSWYDNAKEDTYAYAQSTYDSCAKEDTYAYAQPTYGSYAKEDTYAYAQPTYGSYDASYEQSYSLHVDSDESTWFPNQSYRDVYKEEESQYQTCLTCKKKSSRKEVQDETRRFFGPGRREFLSSYDAENKTSAQPIYYYNQHFGEQALHVQVDPPETVYSHKLEYYENFSTYDNQNDIDNLEMLRHSSEIQPYTRTPDDPLEPYKPSWSMNLGYYEACTEGVAPEYDNHTLASGEYGDMASLFVSSFYPQQTQIYGQYHGNENISLQQNFQSNWNVFSEDASQITKTGDDSNHLNGSFWSFGEYSTYTV